MKNVFIYSLFLCCYLWQGTAQSQIRQYYHKDPNGLLEMQTEFIFKQSYTVLNQYPPDTLHTPERKLALFALDGILHDKRLDTSSALKKHFDKVVNRVIDSLKTIAVDEGIRIYKVYNHGFILQSKSGTIAIDLVRGRYIDDATMQQLVSLSDILFVTHRHGDHADSKVADMFTQQGKKVVVPTGLWENKSKHYVHLRNPSGVLTEDIVFNKNKKLRVKVFPGHQDAVPNNVYAITTPENITVMHTGDQANKEDRSWIRNIKNEVHTDILLLHCWMPNMKEAITGINPTIIVTGHENELGHTIDHREPYWLTFHKLKGISTPYVIMAWGEFFWYKKERQ